MTRQTTAKTDVRRLLLVACLASATGCAAGGGGGLNSYNPFAQHDAPPPAAEPASSPGVAAAVSGFAQGTRAQASSMGLAIKSAFAKGRDSVTGVLGGDTTITDTESGEKLAESDPLLLKNKPTSVGPEVFVANGQLWEATGNFDRAMENYTKALEKEPTNGAALASIARLHNRQQRYAPAVEFFQRAIAATPNDAGLYNDMGLALSKLDRHDEALKTLEKALAVAPGNARYANNLATIHFEAGHEAEARGTLLRYNRPAVAHYNMAYLLYSANRTDQAVKELAQVLELSDQAQGDPASEQAVARSKDLMEKLGAASQIARALPAAQAAITNSAQPAAKVAGEAGEVAIQLRKTAGGVSAQLSDAVVPASATTAPTPGATATTATTTSTAPSKPTAPNAATTSATASAPAASSPPASSGFSLPPEFSTPQARVAERPSAAGTTR